MVKIIDVTKEEERRIEQGELELKLAKECFVGKKVKLLGDFTIQIFDKSKELAYKIIQRPEMNIYDEKILPQAEIFAQKYEEQFGLQNDFIIHTNYSQNK